MFFGKRQRNATDDGLSPAHAWFMHGSRQVSTGTENDLPTGVQAVMAPAAASAAAILNEQSAWRQRLRLHRHLAALLKEQRAHRGSHCAGGCGCVASRPFSITPTAAAPPM